MKRSSNDSSSFTSKSSKRLKLEHEIFSKSIRDIEHMFSGSDSVTTVSNTQDEFRPKLQPRTRQRTLYPPPPPPPPPSAPVAFHYLNTDIIASNPSFNYDFVNPSFLEERQVNIPRAPSTTCYFKNNIPILPSQKHVSQQQEQFNSEGSGFSKDYIDLIINNDDYDDENDDLLNFKSSFTQDVSLIDQLIMMN
ncbi:uncharacterized protein SPAPADRAFT_63454 [Spathaspora passalidarum NRRL Y-27907]|uniref:Uncharacterized protein n=1 Tax=Spathaspora passalidarum (strain NRRL Y-27907 / 11-Y1) TaxID=619300 RepID=G3AUS0_SPAPN|nr:uncharacterized protein SPAPADRAFT_63454 [Spathaspora passalidarum NRRL Y-27907]EGW30626.1 hypothetical protein SPAPADRAFT_63454 [Spathaspora passalidarum NRRL Y-27907]